MQHYLSWHYSRALKEFFHVAKNLLWFIINFFSLPQLIRSLFAPFRRITEERGNRFSLEDLAGYIIIGIISRVIGFILRLTIILTGATILILLSVLFAFTYVFWLMAPLALVAMIAFGLHLLVTPK